MSLWSNIPECASTCSAGRTRSSTTGRSGGTAVSSSAGTTTGRAPAASTPRSRRCIWESTRSSPGASRASTAVNLISQSILPLLFREEGDYERVSQGDEWRIEGVREAIATGEQTLVVISDDGTEIGLEIRPSPREREVLLAGGTPVFSRATHRKGNGMAVKEGWRGRFFEDFEVGDVYEHPLGRTVTTTDNIWFTLLSQSCAARFRRAQNGSGRVQGAGVASRIEPGGSTRSC